MDARGVFCNRTLNMRSVKAVGYDMDYTLVHYKVDAWEHRAYAHLKERLLALDWPVADLVFDPEFVIRGLIIDRELGNVCKANRFGFVKKALHGTRALDFEEQRKVYARTIVDLAEPRWVFLNTSFALSESCMYAQLVELLDKHALPGVMGYSDLYRFVRSNLDAAHLEGKLKAEIVSDPDRFVEAEPDTALALLDQRAAGKKLLLITNSDWSYTVAMMQWSLERFLPKGMTWRELFDVVIVGARKPEFFTTQNPFFEVATAEWLLRPATGDLEKGKAYLGGSAVQLEKNLKLSGDEILYVGDHMFGDVHVTKNVLRWRTALILRELEEEVRAIESFRATEAVIAARMEEKERLESELCQIRLSLQRRRAGYGQKVTESDGALHARTGVLRQLLDALDKEVAPLAKAANELNNPRWGLLTRAGNDKSHMARQVERYADIYTSRVSNFLFATPFVYLRSPRGSLPHDPSVTTAPAGAPGP